MLALWPLAAGAQDVTAQDVTARGVARSVSIFVAVAKHCPATHDVDVERARDYENAFREIGAKSFAKTFSTELKRELPRREQEVKRMGARAWCEDQRRRLEETGIQDVFGD